MCPQSLASGEPYKQRDGEGRELGFNPEDRSRLIQLQNERLRYDIILGESEGRFRLLADTAPVMIWMSGPDKLCTYFNKRWLDFTGRPLVREVGTGWCEGVYAADLERCLDTYVRAFDLRQEFRMEYRLRRFDGAYRWIVDTGVPRFDADGVFEGYIGSCIDITESRQAEENARVLRDELARVGRVTILGELAASIAHEVNQPLCAIVSNAQAAVRLLAGGCGDLTQVREALQDIVQDGKRASAVIAGIRGSLRKAPAEFTPVDVNALIREVAALMRSDLAKKGAAPKLELAEKLPLVLGDRVQLQQVILNLLVNAANALDHAAGAAPAGTPHEVVIRSSANSDGAVAVAVADPGVGIDPRNVDRVFDAFFTTKKGGMGMGLTICKSIVEAHGGRIAAKPQAAPAGKGTTFQFTLPGIQERAP
jgi:PAS domain S-box-containing protein